jgi:alpha-tubulin suppressor-like RCC1 family protein
VILQQVWCNYFVYSGVLIFYVIVEGLVSGLKDQDVQKVALGKAHAVALTSKGHVFTFGINNKGQCGREFAVQVREGKYGAE